MRIPIFFTNWCLCCKCTIMGNSDRELIIGMLSEAFQAKSAGKGNDEKEGIQAGAFAS